MAKATTEQMVAQAKALGVTVTVSTAPKGAKGEIAPLPGIRAMPEEADE